MSYHIDQLHFPSTQVYLNSAFADAFADVPTKRSYAYFIFKEPVLNLPQAYTCIMSLASAEIPVSYYVVNSTNNIFKFTYGGTSYSITVPPGNYSAQDMSLQLVYQVNGVFRLTTIYSDISNQFQFNFFNLSSSTKNITIGGNGRNVIFRLSGNLISGSALANQTGTVISDYAVDLAGTRCMYVKCLNIHTQAYDSKTKYSGSILARIPINQEPNGIVYWNNYSGFKSKVTLKTLSNFEIQITDEAGNLIDFNNVDWGLNLQIDIIQQSSDYMPDIPFQ